MRPGIDISAPKVPVRRIVREAAQIFRVTEWDIASRSRMRPLVRARQAISRVAYDHGWSTPHIGKILGGRDKTTILYARDQVDIHAPRDEVFAAKVDLLQREVSKLIAANRDPLSNGEAA